MLHVTAIRAGIAKRVNPHSFRHARASNLANFLTEAQMKEYLGWVGDSRMASTYVHLSGRNIDNALFKLNGIKTEDEVNSEEHALGVNVFALSRSQFAHQRLLFTLRLPSRRENSHAHAG